MLPIGAQIRGNSIVVTVEPDHQDWNYCVGETASFTVEVRRSGTLINDVSIDYAAGPEMYQDVKKSLTLKEGKMKLSGKMSQPGFYRVDVTAHVGGKDYHGACAAAFSPEKLQPSTIMPSDFADFWPEYQNLDELKDHYRRGGLGDMKCKKFLNQVLNKFLEPMRQRRAEFEKDIPEIYNILKKGTEQAREVGAQTMDEVRKAMRIDYFNDAELIRQQAERFAKK